MICGPNLKNPGNTGSINPWYEDLSLGNDGGSQWRYNEHSISIQVGLLYSIMALSEIDENPAGEVSFTKTKLLTPSIGDKVTGEVSIKALPGAGVKNVEMALGSETGSFKQMEKSGDLYTQTLDVTNDAPYSSKRIVLRSTLADGSYSYTTEHVVKAADLPDATTRQLYDDMDGNGVFGSKKINNWVMWWANGGPPTSGGTSPKSTIDGRVVKTLTTPRAPSSGTVAFEGQFRPEGDLPDWTGYKYLYINAKNTGDAELKFVVDVKPGTRSKTITIPVNNDWTEYKFDLDELFKGSNHKAEEFYIWVIPGAGNIGKLSIDTIEVGNEGDVEHAPQLLDSSVNRLTGDERTNFHFKTTYVSPINNEPFVVQAVIDGIIYDMIEEDETDKNFVDGKNYILSKELPRGVHNYYFRTSDLTAGVESDKKDDLVVTAFSGVPNAPKTPGNLRVIEKIGNDVMLKWDASKGEIIPEKYEIYNGDSKLGEVNGDVTAYTTTELESGNIYELNIVAKIGAQGSDPSNVIVYDTGTLPIEFEQDSPADNEMSVQNSTDIKWKSSSNAESYSVVVSKNKDFSSPLINKNVGNVTSYNLAGLEFSTTYYWKVIAHNNFGDTTALNHGSKFTTRAPVSAEAVRYEARLALTGPNERKTTADWPGSSSALTNGWAKRYATGDITWQAHFPTTGSYDFTVRVYDDSDSPQVFSVKVDGVEVTPRYSMSSKDRKWKDYSGSLGNIAAGTHTIAVAYHTNTAGVNLFLGYLDVLGSAPGAFTLQSPGNAAEAQSVNPVLNWQQTIAGINYSPFGATSYSLIVSDKSDFSNPFFDEDVGIVTSRQLFGLEHDTNYYWKVIAHGVNGNTESNVFNFRTEALPKPTAKITAAMEAIDALPELDNITLDDKAKVVEAREVVNVAKAAGAVDSDITNLQKLIKIEERMIELENAEPITVSENINNLLATGKEIVIGDSLSNVTIPNKALDKQFTELGESAEVKLTLSTLQNNEAVEYTQELVDLKKTTSKYKPIGMLIEFNAVILEDSTMKRIERFGQKVNVELSLEGLEASNVDVTKLGVYRYDEGKSSWDFAGGKYNAKTNTVEFKTADTGVYSVFDRNPASR